MVSKKLTLVLILALSSSAWAAEVREWRFRADVDGRPIGEHTFRLMGDKEERKLLSEAEFKVKFLFFTAYTYRHQAQEQWSANCLKEITSETRENSELLKVAGRLDGGKFILSGPKGRMTLESCPMSFAYWNPEILTRKKLLNPQTGEWLDVNIERLGVEVLEVKGRKVKAEKFRLLAPKTEIELWYSTEDRNWVGLRSKTPEGYIVSYSLI
jgi:hypothetical protein